MTDDEILKQLGQNLNNLRSRRGMSASDTGKVMELSPDAIYKFERGDRELGIIRLVRIHERLNCSYMSILDGLDGTHYSDKGSMEFNVLSPVTSAIMRNLATQWNGDIEALLIFAGMVASWPEEERRELYMQSTIINDRLLQEGVISKEDQPDGIRYMINQIGKMY